jgi:hypothetical protein
MDLTVIITINISKVLNGMLHPHNKLSSQLLLNSRIILYLPKHRNRLPLTTPRVASFPKVSPFAKSAPTVAVNGQSTANLGSVTNVLSQPVEDAEPMPLVTNGIRFQWVSCVLCPRVMELLLDFQPNTKLCWPTLLQGRKFVPGREEPNNFCVKRMDLYHALLNVK